MWFEATADAPSRARRWLASLLPDEAREAGLVAASEIITNALVHDQLDSRDGVAVHVAPSSQQLRVSVRHRGETFPAIPRLPGQGQVGGWGLQLVQALSKAWGVERADEHGVTVWFEV